MGPQTARARARGSPTIVKIKQKARFTQRPSPLRVKNVTLRARKGTLNKYQFWVSNNRKMMPELRHSASDAADGSDFRASIGPTSNSSVISGAASDYTSSCSSSIDRDSFNYNLEPAEPPAPRGGGSSGITKAFANCSLCGTYAPPHNCSTTLSPADILLPLAAAKKHSCPVIESFSVIPLVNVLARTEADEKAKKRSSTCTDVESKDLGSLLDIQFPMSYGGSYDNFVDIDIGEAEAEEVAAASAGSSRCVSGIGIKNLSVALRCNIDAGGGGDGCVGVDMRDLTIASSPEIGSVFVRGGMNRSRRDGCGVFEEKCVNTTLAEGRTSIEYESGTPLVARSLECDDQGLMFDLEV
jgi:hypothetical protein